jgi:hypothetical protein
MIVDGLPLPQELLVLLESGRWPRSSDEAHKQNACPLVPRERVRAMAPGERGIYLYPPPFHTIARGLRQANDSFYRQFGALEQLDPELAIEIGDFGMGADAPILLDYQKNSAQPQVLRLRWPGNGHPNYWETMCPDFRSFIEALGL